MSPLLKGLPKNRIINIDGAIDSKFASINNNDDNLDTKFLFSLDLSCKDNMDASAKSDTNNSKTQYDSATVAKITEEENEIYSTIHVNLLTAMHQQKSTLNDGASSSNGNISPMPLFYTIYCIIYS